MTSPKVLEQISSRKQIRMRGSDTLCTGIRGLIVTGSPCDLEAQGYTKPSDSVKAPSSLSALKCPCPSFLDPKSPHSHQSSADSPECL